MVLVWRSTVVRGSKKAHEFLSSFATTRAVSACCVHSHRALVSNDTQLMQACSATPHREQRASEAIGNDR